MFIAIILIAIGLALLLNSLGIVAGSFWGFFWAIILIAVGIKMLNRKNYCPLCHWKMWKSKCDCGPDCDCHDHKNESEIDQ